MSGCGSSSPLPPLPAATTTATAAATAAAADNSSSDGPSLPPPLLQPIATRDTPFQPSSIKVSLNLRLDGCIVPTTAGGARVDYAHLVVLDGFLDEPTRAGLLHFLTQPGWPQHSATPPADKWARTTADAAARPATWGLRPEVLAAFAEQPVPAKLEVQSRLAKLFPDMLIAHMPSDHIQLGLTDQQQQQQPGGRVDCSCFLANAAVQEDQFSWHQDADPQSFPVPSAWSDTYGIFCNREPGKPVFVSLLLYLDADWPRDLHAETLFLDSMTDTGVFVRPRPYRAVLMDQDVVHRLSTPSAAAGRPRYSLVWKLVMLPRAAAPIQHGKQGQQQQQPGPPGDVPPVACIARPEWGRPTYFGSAATAERAARQAAAGLL